MVRKIEQLRRLIAKQPGNANLHLELGVYLSCVQLPTFNEPYKEYTFFSLTNSFSFNYDSSINEAKSELTTAIALGLDDYMLSVKAKLLLAYIDLLILQDSINDLMPSSIESQTLGFLLRRNEANGRRENRNLEALRKEYKDTIPVVCNDVLKDIKGLLRRKPYDIEGLIIQKALYNTLGNNAGYIRTKMRLQEALALQKLTGAAEEIDISSSTPISKSRKNSGIGLEELTKDLLASMGLKAATTKTTADGGIDLIAHSENAIFSGKYIVQCKDWTAPVGEPVIRDLYGVVMSEGANKGIVITTGSFTPAARKFAEGKQIELIDGDELKRLQQKYLQK